MLQSLSTDGPPPPPRWLDRLIRARYLLLALYVIGAIAIVWDLFFHASSALLGGHGNLASGGVEWKPTLIAAAIFLLMPTLFLIGVPHLRWPQPTRGRWMGITMTLGALWAALISAGIGAALFSLVLPKQDFSDALDLAARNNLGLLIVVSIPWAGWLLFFSMIWAGNWIVVFRRMYRLLLAGTVLELLITIPIDVQVRKRTQCYCDEGTFWALTIGITMAFWTFGPGIFLLFLARRMQRLNQGICTGCGYDLRGSSGSRCPECGRIIRRPSTGPKTP